MSRSMISINLSHQEISWYIFPICIQGNEEDDIEFSDEDSLDADRLESLFSEYDTEDKNKKFIKIQCLQNEDITPVLLKLICDGFILKKSDVVRSPNGDTHRFIVIGQVPPTSLN